MGYQNGNAREEVADGRPPYAFKICQQDNVPRMYGTPLYPGETAPPCFCKQSIQSSQFELRHAIRVFSKTSHIFLILEPRK